MQEAREVQIQREGEVLKEVGGETEDELPGDERRPRVPVRRAPGGRAAERCYGRTS
jgi:hypothetical protein